MKSLVLFLVIFFSSAFLYLSKAQQLCIRDINNQPVQDAAVSIQQSSSSKSFFLISDNSGSVNLKGYAFPLFIHIHHIAFKDVNDTLTSSSSKIVIKLIANTVNLKTISVTGNYSPSLAERSVYKVDVISREQIDRHASSNLSQLLSQQLNMRIERDQSLGSSLLLQGMSGENIKFLVDGVPLLGRKGGLIDLSQINLNNVDHVEVIKGSMSVLYGTDAAGGVINIITKNNSKEKLNGGLNTYYENIGQYNVDGFAGWRFKKTDVLVTGGRNFFDGWSKVDSNERFFDWKPKEQYLATAKITQQFNGLHLTLQSDYMHNKVINKSAEVRGMPYSATTFDEYENTTRFNNQLFADFNLNQDYSINLTGAYSFYESRKNTYFKNLVDLSQILSPDSADHDTTRFYSTLIRYTFNRAKAAGILNYQLGLEVNNEQGSGKRIDAGVIHNIGDYALFGSLEYKPVKWFTIRPGLRYAYNTSYKSPLIPSLNFLVEATKNISARASYSRGFRAPNLKEMYLSFFDANHSIAGNPDLQSEDSEHAEASLSYKYLGEKVLVQLEPSVFYNVVNDKIALVQKPSLVSLFTYVNVEKFISKGVEFQTHLTMNNFHFNAGANYTAVYNTFYGTIGNADLAWSPSINSSVDYTFSKTNTTFSAFAKFNGKQPVYLINSTDNNLVRFINDDYALLDLNLSQRFLKERLVITTGLMNVLDVTNVKTYSTAVAHSNGNSEALVGMGRSAFIKLQLHF